MDAFSNSSSQSLKKQSQVESSFVSFGFKNGVPGWCQMSFPRLQPRASLVPWCFTSFLGPYEGTEPPQEVEPAQFLHVDDGGVDLRYFQTPKLTHSSLYLYLLILFTVVVGRTHADAQLSQTPFHAHGAIWSESVSRRTKT